MKLSIISVRNIINRKAVHNRKELGIHDKKTQDLGLTSVVHTKLNMKTY